MWKRKVLKKKTRTLIKKSYWGMISVCFIIAVLTTAYPLSTTFFSLQTTSAVRYADMGFTPLLPNSEIIQEMLENILNRGTLFRFFDSPASEISGFLVDFFSSNVSIFFSALRAVNILIDEPLSLTAFFPLFGFVLLILYKFFICNLLLVGEKRYFLENRNYSRTPISKIFFLFKLRYLKNPAWIMFCRNIFQGLWDLTIVGGIIKHYEYILIPYIVAENPKIQRKDAFFLTKHLMHKNKRKLFLLDLSFLGWNLLSLLTLGLLDFFFVNPYITGCHTELYATLRRNYVLSRSPRYERLNDSYLEHVLSEDELLISKALYDDSQGPYTQISYFEPNQYPAFLFSIQPPIKAVRSFVHADRKYDIYSCLFLFTALSFLGWLMEVLTGLITEGTFTDPSPLIGPWLPLYGLYGIIIHLAAKHLHKTPVLAFIFNLIVYTILEYLSGWLIETLFGYRWQDYSEFFLNINGRVYAGGSVFCALIGCAFIYYLAPKWTNLYMKLGRSKRIFVSIVLCILLVSDLITCLFAVDF